MAWPTVLGSRWLVAPGYHSSSISLPCDLSPGQKALIGFSFALPTHSRSGEEGPDLSRFAFPLLFVTENNSVLSSPQDSYEVCRTFLKGAMGKSAGVSETKQKAFHAQESFKVLDIDYPNRNVTTYLCRWGGRESNPNGHYCPAIFKSF